MTENAVPESTEYFPPAPVLTGNTAAAATDDMPSGALATSDATPRTRWAAIIWGAVFAATAAVALWVTVSPDRRAAVADWTIELSPAAVAAYLVLAVGAIALVAGLAGIARRAQRALAHGRAR